MTDDATYRKMKQERDLALAECERLRALLICTRSSVALDLRMYGQFLDRKGAGANDCDTEEYARIEKLLNDIDTIDAARGKP